MKSCVYIENPPMDGATDYTCPACHEKVMLRGVIPDGMVVWRRCTCKTRAPDGSTERTMVEITSKGVRVVPPGVNPPVGMREFRCEFCKHLLCKYIPARGGVFAIKCWRNNRCMRNSTFASAVGACELEVVE